MAYVAVKGGEQAIRNAEGLLAARRRGDPAVPELSLEQIKQQLQLAVNRVMAEGSLYDPDLAALAIKQSWGDLVEAAFLLRAYRTTLPRLYYSQPLDTGAMAVQRRISAIACWTLSWPPKITSLSPRAKRPRRRSPRPRAPSIPSLAKT